jgi:hypothetical protein
MYGKNEQKYAICNKITFFGDFCCHFFVNLDARDTGGPPMAIAGAFLLQKEDFLVYFPIRPAFLITPLISITPAARNLGLP